METRRIPSNGKRDDMFKSYYVVWKPSLCQETERIFFRLNRTMQYGNLQILHAPPKYISFKSYYVVWKQISFSNFSISFFCLNRTMQYGNLKHIRIRRRILGGFKSYYVVWKRIHGDRCLNPQIGLNRTMQYGNYYIIKCFSLFF